MTPGCLRRQPGVFFTCWGRNTIWRDLLQRPRIGRNNQRHEGTFRKRTIEARSRNVRYRVNNVCGTRTSAGLPLASERTYCSECPRLLARNIAMYARQRRAVRAETLVPSQDGRRMRDEGILRAQAEDAVATVVALHGEPAGRVVLVVRPVRVTDTRLVTRTRGVC